MKWESEIGNFSDKQLFDKSRNANLGSDLMLSGTDPNMSLPDSFKYPSRGRQELFKATLDISPLTRALLRSKAK
jgi:hypothetical protein